jgi:DNA invertase Pin-like site-specific DNA recombinase
VLPWHYGFTIACIVAGVSRWAGIVRVSHMGDRKAGAEDFHADAEQVAAIERYAKAHGATVEFLPPELSVSGGRPIEHRPSLRAAIEGVERGEYSGIVVAYLSRLTRSRSGLRIWERVEAAGGHVHSAAEQLDTSSPNGRFIRDIHLANAVREREEHIDRFDERRRMATEAGVWQRRQTPTGYRRDERTRKLVPDESAGRVREAFRRRGAGASLSSIAELLSITTSGARHLLANRVYLGELRVGDYVNEAAHPALVGVDEFLAAQSARVLRGPRVRDEPALLAGLVRCAGCGHVMSRGRTKAEVYACHGRMSAGRCPAPAAVTLRLLDDHVTGIARAQLARLAGTPVDDQALVDEARAVVAEAERELEAFLAGVSAAGISPDDYAAAARERRRAVEAARERLGELARRQTPVVSGDPVELWERLDVEQRNRLLRGLVEAVVVRRAGGRGHVVPVADRVRVIAFGAGLVEATRRGGAARPIRPIVLPDVDDPAVLRVDLAE